MNGVGGFIVFDAREGNAPRCRRPECYHQAVSIRRILPVRLCGDQECVYCCAPLVPAQVGLLGGLA